MGRTKLQKVILIVMLAMAVLFAALTGVVRATNKGVAFEGGLLSVQQEDGRTVYSGKAEGQKVTVTVYDEADTRVVHLSAGVLVDQTYRVEYPGGTIAGPDGEYRRIRITVKGRTFLEEVLFEGGYNPDATFSSFCDSDGEAMLPVNARGYASGHFWDNYEMFPSQVMNFAEGPATTCRGDWTIYILALVCSIIVAVDVAFPRLLFYLNHFLAVRDPEQTDLHIIIQRGSWVVLTAVLMGLYIWGLTQIV